MNRCTPFVWTLCALLAGCGQADNTTRDVSFIGERASLFQTDRLPLPPAAAMVRAATMQGLVARDASGELVPALAQRWIVTDDGQSYIFRLQDTLWNDGTKITAAQVAESLRQQIQRARRGQLAPDLTTIRDVRAMTGQVIEIRLNAPKPDLLQIFTEPELGISRKGYGTGPLVKTRQGDYLDFAPRPPAIVEDDTQDADDIRTPALRLRAERAARAIARYREGYSMMVLGGGFSALPFVDIAGVNRSELKIDPVGGLFGLIFVENGGFLADASRREAISMAIDRTRIRSVLNIDSDDISNRMVPAFVEDYTSVAPEPWADVTMDQRRATARARVAAWQADRENVPPLRIAMPEGPGATLLFAAIRADLIAIGLDAKRVRNSASADLRLIDEVAAHSRASWYIGQLSCLRQRVCDAAGNTLWKEAMAEKNLSARALLLAEAERSMTAYASYIPLGQPIRWSLVRGDASGFAVNAFAAHPLSPMLAVPK